MTKDEMIEQFKSECDNLRALIAAKNAGYAPNGSGAFENFELIEHVTDGHISREQGALVRMTDKLHRIWGLLNGVGDHVGESFTDTCRDLAGYSLLLLLMYADTEKGKWKRLTVKCSKCGHDMSLDSCGCQQAAMDTAAQGWTNAATCPGEGGGVGAGSAPLDETAGVNGSLFQRVFGGLKG